MDKEKKVAYRKLRKKAIRIQNTAFPRKISMAEAIKMAAKGSEENV